MNETQAKEKWYTGVTRYQWLVLAICAIGWMFDIFEGQIFVASMNEAMPSFLKDIPLELRGDKAEFYNSVAMASFLLGGTLGGIVFGMMSDRIGRKRAMAWSILFYSFFTWTTAFSVEWWHLAALRFFVAIGVGGQWAVASTYVAETFPSKARAHAASIFHAFGSMGTLLAAVVGTLILGNTVVLAWCQTSFLMTWLHHWYEPTTLPWRLCFTVGLLPSIVVFFIFAWLKEPESWKAVQEQRKKDPKQKVGEISELFKNETIRATIVGVTLAAIGMATMWAIHVRGKDALKLAVQNKMIAEGLVPFATETVTGIGPNGEEVERIKETERYALTETQITELKRWEMLGMALTSIGMLLGQLYFGPLSQKIGRKNAFVVFHLGGFAITVIVFQWVSDIHLLYVLLPVFGFLTAGMYSGYSVYFPELYPTRLRGTGTGFCFNMGRLMASPFILAGGWLVTYGGLTLSSATTILGFLYLLGPMVLLFARETKGQELME